MGENPEGNLPSSASQNGLPPFVAGLRAIASLYLAIFKQFRVVGAEQIPMTGPVILVANHTTAYDPVCLAVACRGRFVRFMQAREYYEQKPLVYLFKRLQIIPVNRTGVDTASIRTALRTLAAGGCIGIFPEGKISDNGKLQEARKGVALLALASNSAVVPAYLHGTRPFRSILRDYMQFNRVTLYFGPAIRFDDLAGQQRNREALDEALNRIVNGILTLRDAHMDASVK